MNRSLMVIFVVALMVAPLAIVGCKGKVDSDSEMARTESTEATAPLEDIVVSQSPVTESSLEQSVSQETIPPTAALPQGVDESTKAVSQDKLARDKDIQIALKAAGFYTGSIDGKIGPKTKRAITEFQKAKGLKTDGRVGPKTWAELEKYLTTQQ